MAPMIDRGGTHVWKLDLPDEAATVALAAEIAPALQGRRPRHPVRRPRGRQDRLRPRADPRPRRDALLEVPSPTFTLMQLYETPRFPVVHADLYRIADPHELEELGWDEAAEGALVLVEWPERAGMTLTGDRLDLAFHLKHRGEGAREVSLTGHGSWSRRLERLAAAGRFLRAIGWQDAERIHIQGDASTRSYERLLHPSGIGILMNAPKRTDVTPIRFGKTYSEIAHISQDVRPFIAMDRALAARGFSTPRILAEDIEGGVLLLEDLGAEGVVDAQGPIAERYGVAIDALAALHAMHLPATVPVAPGIDHAIPPFDLQAMEIEAELLIDWYLPISARRRSPSAKGWVLRPLARGAGAHHQGAADLAPARRALAEPHLAARAAGRRADRPPGLPGRHDRLARLRRRLALHGRPRHRARGARAATRRPLCQGPQGRRPGLRRRRPSTRDYAIMGAQRLTKILGIFARLDRRDGKPGYLQHIPRDPRLSRPRARPSGAVRGQAVVRDLRLPARSLRR